MSKRIVIGGLLALGLSLVMSGSAQAQYRGGYGGGGNYRGGGGHYHGGGYGGRVYAPVYSVPVYRPVLVAPPVYRGINSPYFGFGPTYGFNQGFGYNQFGGFNNGYVRPGFGLSFNFFR